MNILKESVRQNLLKNDLTVLDFYSTAHNLITCIEDKQWDKLEKKTNYFIHSFNKFVDKLNEKETPTEDRILELVEEMNKIIEGNE